MSDKNNDAEAHDPLDDLTDEEMEQFMEDLDAEVKAAENPVYEDTFEYYDLNQLKLKATEGLKLTQAQLDSLTLEQIEKMQ